MAYTDEEWARSPMGRLGAANPDPAQASYQRGDRNPYNQSEVWNEGRYGGDWSYSPQATNANRAGRSAGPRDMWNRAPQTPDPFVATPPNAGRQRPMDKYEQLMAFLLDEKMPMNDLKLMIICSIKARKPYKKTEEQDESENKKDQLCCSV